MQLIPMSQELLINDRKESLLPKVLERFDGPVLFVIGHHDLINLDDIAKKSISIIRIPPGLPDQDVIQNLLSTIKITPATVVAIGGGRIMDAAKLIIHWSQWQRPYFIAVPTTAGSGSEATPFAVVYKKGEKFSIQDPTLLPDFVLLETCHLGLLSKKQRAISGIDALAQAIESLWNKNADPISKTYASQALRIMLPQQVSFVNEPDALKDKNQLWASYLAGRAISITRTTGCHALSYYLTSRHDIPHGQAVALFLPLFFHYNQQTDLSSIHKLMNVADASAAFDFLNQSMKDCGLATNFRELGIEVNIDALLQSVNAERFGNNPVPFDSVELKKLIIQYLV